MTGTARARKPPPRWLWALKIGGTLIALGYVAWKVDFGEVGLAFTRIDPLAFIAACAVTFANLGVGATRWRILLSAYGAPRRPPFGQLARIYLVGFFYNTYLPGGVGGDVVRGLVTRSAFGTEASPTASMTVVLVERILGLAGLLLLVSVSSIVRPLPGTEEVLPLSALVLVLAVAFIALLALGRRARLPGRLGRIAASLPPIVRALPFGTALSLSLVTQALVAMTGWFLMASITDGRVSVGDALVLVPLAMAAAYFPLSVGGSGVREAAFIALGTNALGMSEADALVSSLALFSTQLAVAGFGGVLQLVSPLDAGADS